MPAGRRLGERLRTLGLPPAPPGFKYCLRCLDKGKEEPLPVADFYARRGSADGLQNHCKACNTELHAAGARRRREQRELDRAQALVTAHGFEVVPVRPTAQAVARPHRLQALLIAQEGRCVLCRFPERRTTDAGEPVPLSYLGIRIDGRLVEALLCIDCDEALKRLQYSPIRLARAQLLLVGTVQRLKEATLHVG